MRGRYKGNLHEYSLCSKSSTIKKKPFNNKNRMKMDIVNVLAHPVDGT